MAKFCSNCGAQCDDAANVCGTCGSALEGAPVAAPTFDAPVSAEAQSNKKLGVIAVAAVAVIAVVVILLVVLLGGGYKKTVKKFVKAYEQNESDVLEEIYSEIRFDWADDNDYDYVDSLESSVDSTYDAIKDKCGKGFKLSYKFDDVEVLKGDDMEDELEDWGYGDADDNIEDYKISAVAVVELEVTAKGDKKDKDYDLAMVLTKESGKWKVFAAYWDI